MARLCSRCKKNDPTSEEQSYCKSCRNDYMREYWATRVEQEIAKAFQAGASAMRDQLRNSFALQPVGMFAGMEIARYIHEAPSPQRPETSESTHCP